ncbi:MAG TPA: glutaredoxin domain-containing protein [Gammaproteobacteria bacterium]|nr:glutaredoxin domain-containing protein [Gammaproteobacteria bacterium]
MIEIIVYTKDHCPYCDYAKALLKSKELAYTEHNLEGNYDEIASLVAKTNMRTLPQIFVQGQFVGGFTDLQEFDASGKLDHLIGQNK